ncbi:hypothetical protein MTYM_02153 [Methylococcales bacterium]|nr:hypothetical protein MTYM_02153 [Methylococcales bacterium]
MLLPVCSAALLGKPRQNPVPEWFHSTRVEALGFRLISVILDVRPWAKLNAVNLSQKVSLTGVI